VVLLTSTDTTQRSPEVDHGHGAVTHEWGAVCDRNLSHWISEKGPWRRWGLSEEIILFSKVFVTNLQFGRVRFFFKVSEVSIFFVVPTEPSIRTHRWCAEGNAEAPAGGSKVLSQWTLNLRVYAHTCTQTKEI